ncbi:hypothetical protein CBR_g3074 [Chara braunii]|uniref:Uncharacterized protein n=1 Tax=Chara braunii TaxID=69332 RepID=A0A388KEQ2_CHABU|nr:hypothetical protein CBR_g3074 [Chara braunii]|eukprot:GBG68530.1 hypothetical protein CBR_g3074 [Chara braunii]
MSFLTEQALGEHLLTPRGLGDHLLTPWGYISAIWQVCHPRLNQDLLRMAKFFCTSGVYAAAEFRFAGSPQVVVLAEAVAIHRRSAPRISHVSTVVGFSGDISTVNALRHTAIRTTPRKWAQQLAMEWNCSLTRRGDNLFPTDGVELKGIQAFHHEPAWRLRRKHFVELSACLVGVQITWTRDEDHRHWSEYLEGLIIQAWRTDVEGDLLGFLFGSVRPSHRQPIVLELTVPLAQLADDLPLEIVSQNDNSPIPHVPTRTLAPYLQWSACLEEPENDYNPPSQRDYLSPREIIDPTYFRDRTATEDEAIAAEEEEEEKEKDDEEETPEEGSYIEHSEGEQSEQEEEEEEKDDEEETPEEGSYSEHSEGEQSEQEEEEEQDDEEEELELEGSECEISAEEGEQAGAQAEDPEAARRR